MKKVNPILIEELIVQLHKEVSAYFYFCNLAKQFDEFSQDHINNWNIAATINNDYINPLQEVLKAYGVDTKMILREQRIEIVNKIRR